MADSGLQARSMVGLSCSNACLDHAVQQPLTCTAAFPGQRCEDHDQFSHQQMRQELRYGMIWKRSGFRPIVKSSMQTFPSRLFLSRQSSVSAKTDFRPHIMLRFSVLTSIKLKWVDVWGRHADRIFHREAEELGKVNDASRTLERPPYRGGMRQAGTCEVH